MNTKKLIRSLSHLTLEEIEDDDTKYYFPPNGLYDQDLNAWGKIARNIIYNKVEWKKLARTMDRQKEIDKLMFSMDFAKIKEQKGKQVMDIHIDDLTKNTCQRIKGKK